MNVPNKIERLILYCELINPVANINAGNASGQYLDAIAIENQTHHLHIGTEDGEAMKHRAKHNDWMPTRFVNELDDTTSFTEYLDFGFQTSIPSLRHTEKIYFHFLVATHPTQPSVTYPPERGASTWFAVDMSKAFLDAHLTGKL